MTPAQEHKIDKLFEMVSGIQGDMKVYKNEQEHQSDAIISNLKNIISINKKMEIYDADKNNMKGMVKLGGLLGGVGGITGIIALIWAFVTKHIF